ncbi:MAG TPA: hypothetical protein VMU73_08625 [Gaiellaceae bacterium]|nr:hypothetical protein [Gaiellaceae bacterium]
MRAIWNAVSASSSSSIELNLIRTSSVASRTRKLTAAAWSGCETIRASTTKLVSRRTSAGRGVSVVSNEKTCLVEGGRPRGRTRYFPRTERGKLIDVFALTLLVAALMPLLAVVLREEADLLFDLALR